MGPNDVDPNSSVVASSLYSGHTQQQNPHSQEGVAHGEHDGEASYELAMREAKEHGGGGENIRCHGSKKKSVLRGQNQVRCPLKKRGTPHWEFELGGG